MSMRLIGGVTSLRFTASVKGATMHTEERVPVPVRVVKKERREEPQRLIEDLPPDWRPQPIPKRWMV